jgi:hypothetical protein
MAPPIAKPYTRSIMMPAAGLNVVLAIGLYTLNNLLARGLALIRASIMPNSIPLMTLTIIYLVMYLPPHKIENYAGWFLIIAPQTPGFPA